MYGDRSRNERKPKTRIGGRALASLLFALVLVCAAGASTAFAATKYVFDPQLSLTGGCTTDGIDEVLDPGCPYRPFPEGPSEPFSRATGLATDAYGDVYVAVEGPEPQDKGHIDIFNAKSEFITELPLASMAPRTIAVDSKGYLYVYSLSNTGLKQLLRYRPSVYDPSKGEIAYGTPPTVIAESYSDYVAMAVNPEDHLFVDFGVDKISTPNGSAIQEFGSGEEGNPQKDASVASVCCFDGPGLAIDVARGRLYATDQAPSSPGTSSIRFIDVFELAPPHHLIETIDGSSTPEGSFVTEDALGLAVNEATGHIFAYDKEKLNVIYELSEDGQYLASIKHSLSSREHKTQVLVDNGAHSPHGALDPEGRYLWATADPGGVGHAFAFRPSHECAPTVESTSVDSISETEAQLRAEVEPCNLETGYRFEYVSAERFAESGFANAQVAGEGTIPAGAAPVEVSAGAAGLTPGTAYRFRVVATNSLGEGSAEGSFKTYSTSLLSTGCSNEAWRVGASALLPDCRAYELVSPANTNGLEPVDSDMFGFSFISRTVSPDGSRASFVILGGILPGADGTGSLAGDPYSATRGPEGWSTQDTGGKGSEYVAVLPQGRSPEQGFTAWQGTVSGGNTNMLTFPDGHSEVLGRGALGTDPAAVVDLVGEGGEHVVFSSDKRLEEQAPSPGQAIYDRTSDGVTHVVSLLPNSDIALRGTEYVGGSGDGKGIAYAESAASSSPLYFRYDEKSFDIGTKLTFEGVAEGGKRIFYLKAGSLYAFDVEGGVIPFVTSGDATVVNVARNGTTAFFVSPSRLTSSPNPLGAKAKAGSENLYLSREGSLEFVGVVTESDVAGEGASEPKINALGGWAREIHENTIGGMGDDPSRATGDGSVLLFRSHADLTGEDSDGMGEIYRYDSVQKTLLCVSCPPTERPPASDARLQSLGGLGGFPTSRFARIENLTSDGSRAFFETSEALVPADVDGRQDVYEWEANGAGICSRAPGCVSLISSGNSAHDNYLYGVSDSGDDVFVATEDLLLPERDPDATMSIYDARVGGGFPAAVQQGECLGEACQPTLAPPARPAQVLEGLGNVLVERQQCPKGQSAVSGNGRTRCTKRDRRRHHRRNRRRRNHRRHHKHHRNKKAGTKGRKSR